MGRPGLALLRQGAEACELALGLVLELVLPRARERAVEFSKKMEKKRRKRKGVHVGLVRRRFQHSREKGPPKKNGIQKTQSYLPDCVSSTCWRMGCMISRQIHAYVGGSGRKELLARRGGEGANHTPEVEKGQEENENPY